MQESACLDSINASIVKTVQAESIILEICKYTAEKIVIQLVINPLSHFFFYSTPIKTEMVSSVVKCLELFIGNPLQWSLDLRHANELRFRHVLDYY